MWLALMITPSAPKVMAPTAGPERKLHVPVLEASRARLSVSLAGKKSRGDTKAAKQDQEMQNSALTQRRLVEYSRHITRRTMKGR